MKHRSHYSAFALSAVLLAPATGYGAAQQPGQSSPTAPTPTDPTRHEMIKSSEEQRSGVRQLEIFKLEHRDPQEVAQVIRMAERASASDQQYGATSTHSPSMPGHQPGGTTPGATSSHPSLRNTSINDDKRLLTATTADERLLFVRGTEEQLGRVRDLVKAFDVRDEDLTRQPYGVLQLLPVPSGIASTLAELNLRGEIMQSGGIHLLIFRDADGDDQRVKQAERVLQELSERSDRDEAQDDNDETRESGSDRRPGQ